MSLETFTYLFFKPPFLPFHSSHAHHGPRSPTTPPSLISLLPSSSSSARQVHLSLEAQLVPGGARVSHIGIRHVFEKLLFLRVGAPRLRGFHRPRLHPPLFLPSLSFSRFGFADAVVHLGQGCRHYLDRRRHRGPGTLFRHQNIPRQSPWIRVIRKWEAGECGFMARGRFFSFLASLSRACCARSSFDSSADYHLQEHTSRTFSFIVHLSHVYIPAYPMPATVYSPSLRLESVYPTTMFIVRYPAGSYIFSFCNRVGAKSDVFN